MDLVLDSAHVLLQKVWPGVEVNSSRDLNFEKMRGTHVPGRGSCHSKYIDNELGDSRNEWLEALSKGEKDEMGKVGGDQIEDCEELGLRALTVVIRGPEKNTSVLVF